MQLLTMWQTGNTLRIRVGEPINVADLLDEYKAARAEERKKEGIEDGWTSTAVDQELYQKITDVSLLSVYTSAVCVYIYIYDVFLIHA